MAHGAMQDGILPFMIEGARVRGRLVRLGPVVDRILARHHYPLTVAQLLGETLALTCLLAGMLKDDGIFTLQARGDGAIGLLVADLASNGALRGCAAYDDSGLTKALRGQASAPLPRLLGNGYLAFTIDRGDDFERYQGLVELTSATLAECLHDYFRRSEQIHAGIVTACARRRSGWQAGAIMVQPVPEQGGASNCGGLDGCEGDEGWRRALALMGSVRPDELAAPDLSPERLLYRLFHEDGVRVFDVRSVTDRCRCSLERAGQIVRSFANERVEEMSVDGIVTVTCEFCNRSYRFDRPAIARLRLPGGGWHCGVSFS